MIHQLNQLYTSMAARYKILHYTSYWRRYVREHTGNTELTPAEKAAYAARTTNDKLQTS